MTQMFGSSSSRKFTMASMFGFWTEDVAMINRLRFVSSAVLSIVGGDGSVDVDADLHELGLDSLGLAELLGLLEDLAIGSLQRFCDMLIAKSQEFCCLTTCDEPCETCSFQIHHVMVGWRPSLLETKEKEKEDRSSLLVKCP